MAYLAECNEHHAKQAGAVGATSAIHPAFGGKEEEEPDPEPIELKLSDVSKYDAAWFPPGIGEWAAENAELRRVPLDFIAVSTLSTLGSVIGSRVGLRPQENNPGWVEVANLWGMNVAKPGKRKSGGTSAGASFLYALEEAATKEFISAQKEHAKEMKRFEAKVAGAGAAIKEAAKKSHGNLAEVQVKEQEAKDIDAQEPPTPVQRRFVVRKISPERLCFVLAENPWGVMHYHDEMGTYLLGLCAGFSNDERVRAERGLLNEAWNGNQLHSYESFKQGLLYVPLACVTVLGAAQPGPLMRIIHAAMTNDADADGLIQRFSLMSWPDLDGLPLPISEEGHDTALRRKVADIINVLLTTNPTQWGARKDEHDRVAWLPLTPEGWTEFKVWLTDFELRNHNAKEGAALAEHFLKYPTLVAGLALIWELVRWADTAPVPFSAPWAQASPDGERSR